MSIALTVNGVTYNYPTDHQSAGWGAQATGWAEAVTNGLIPKIGGSFTLTGEVDFGPDYGFKLPYIKSQGTNIATAGVVRLGNAETIAWRNVGNSANLSLTVNSNNELVFNGTGIVLDTDPIINPDNIITVQKNPGEGQFDSIKDAVDYIIANGTPSESNRWLVSINPGNYIEPPIEMATGIMASGVSTETVIVSPVTDTDTVFTMAQFSYIQNMSITGCNGIGGRAVSIIGIVAYLKSLKMSDNETDIYIANESATPGAPTVAFLNDIILEPPSLTARKFGIQISSIVAGAPAIVFLNNILLLSDSTEAAFDISGLGTTVMASNLNIDATDQLGSGTALQISNGATVRGNALIRYYNKGLEVLNIGTAVSLNLDVSVIGSVTSDVNIEHPGTQGYITGAFDRTKVTVDSDAPVSLFFSGTEAGQGLTATGSLYLGETFNTTTDVTALIQETTPVGIINGGIITTTANPREVSVSSGYGYVVDTTTLKSKKIEWTTTLLTVPDDSVRYVIINNSGTPVLQTSVGDLVETLIVARIRTGDGEIQFISSIQQNGHHPANHIDNFLRTAIGPIFGTGSILTENTTTDREIDVTGGSYWYSQQNILPTGGAGLSFYTFYHDTGVFVQGTTETVVDNTQYDDGTDLQPLSTGKYTKHSIWLAGDGTEEKYGLIYGIDEWDTILEAEVAPLASPPPYFTDLAVPIAAIIVQEGNNNFAEIIDIRPRIGFQSPSSSASTDHGNLTGLLDDDHPQYLLVNGTRAMSGNLNLGTNNITNVGLVDGVTVSAHASRHLPNGADPITTAAPTTSLSGSSTNSEGIQNSLARSDHSHAITGFQPSDATLTALAAYNTNGLLTQTAADTFTGRTLTGTSNRVSITNGNGVSGNPTVDIDAAYVGQTSITTLGTITSGTWNGTVIGAMYGGTGQTSYATGDTLYASATNTLSKLSGNTTTTRNFLRQTGTGSASAAPAWDTVTKTDVGLSNVENTALSTWAGSANITTLGTISSGTWNGTIIGSTYGGTGVNNGSKTITLGGNLVTSGAFNTTLTVTADTNVTLPTSGTLVNTAVTTLSSLVSVGTITTGVWNGTIVSPTYGGTGINNASKTITLGGNLVTSGAFNTTLTVTADTSVTLPTSGTLVNTAVTTLSSLASIGTITTGVWNGTAIGAPYGGTGQTSYAVGDILYASTTTALSKLADVATGNALLSGGVNTAPSWGKIGLTTHVSGTLGPTNGGTGIATYTLGDILYSNGTNSLGALAGNTTTNKRFLRQTGTGTISAVPAWDSVTATDVGLGNVANVDTTNATNITSGTLDSARLDATLTALAGYNTNGILTQTAADTFTGRTITGTSNTITVTDGDGVSGNPTIDIVDNPIIGGTDSITIPMGTTAQRSGSPTDAMMRYNTSEDILEGYTAPYGGAQSPTVFQRTMMYRKRRTWYDEFMLTSVTAGGIKVFGDLGFTETSGGTAANSVQSGTADHPGIIRIGTGGTNGNNTRLHMGNAVTSTIIMANQVEYFAFLIRIPTITTITSLWGLGTDISSTTFGTAGVWFQFASGTSSSLQFITRNASTSSTAVNTVTFAAATWYLCEAVYNGTTWTPYVNGTAYTAQSSNIPTVAVNAGIAVQTGVNQTRTIDIDMFSMMSRELGVRY